MPNEAQIAMAHRLLDHMYAELVAARSLFMDGLLGQSSLHMVNAWHALACLNAEQQQEPLPELADFEIDPNTLPNADQLKRRAELWTESMDAVRLFSPSLGSGEWIEHHTALQAAPRARRRQYMTLLRFQLKAAEQVYQKLAWRRWQVRLKASLGDRKKTVAAILLVAALVVAGGIQAISTGGGKQVAPPAPPPPAFKIKQVKLAAVSTPRPQGTAFNAEGTVSFDRALAVDLGRVYKSAQVEVSLDNNDDYRLAFVLKQVEQASVDLAMDASIAGLRVLKVKVPEAGLKNGYDEVRIYFVKGDSIHALGHLVLSD